MEKKQRWEKNRKRYRTIAFRCSDSEREELEKRVELSGLQKQDYLIKSSLHQKIVVVGNELMFEKLQDSLADIKAELQRVGDVADLDYEKLYPLRTVIEILEGFEAA